MAGITEDIDLDVLIQSLPACRRCRECKRGCDTLLPACNQCTKAGVECVFFDHVLDEHLPRSYIASLVEHARSLKLSPSQRDGIGPQTAHPTERGHDFAYAVAGGSLRYLGKFSCLITPTLGNPDVVPEGIHTIAPLLSLSISFDRDPITPELHQYLVDTYFELVDPYYPILTLEHRRRLSSLPQQMLVGADAFALNMIYTISCRLAANGEGTWVMLSEHCRSYAMSLFEAITADANLETLRAVLLLAIHSLTDPKIGNLGQQVALATRLAIELATHDLNEEDGTMLDDMSKVVFCLENEMASALDRPATFPEPSHSLAFEEINTLSYLTSMYRVQHQFRIQRRFSNEISFNHWTVPRDPLDSLLLVVLRQTEMLISLSSGSAIRLLAAFIAHRGFENYFHPQWVFNAALILIRSRKELEVSQFMDAIGKAQMLLARYTIKWSEVSLLHQELNKQIQM